MTRFRVCALLATAALCIGAPAPVTNSLQASDEEDFDFAVHVDEGMNVTALGKKCKVTQAGQGCSAFKKCCSPLKCGANFKCYEKVGFMQGCSAFKQCADGLSCQPGKHKCYHVPRRLEEPCSAGFGCGSGLSCQPGVHKCYDSPRKWGQPCAVGHPCAGNDEENAEALECDAYYQVCRYKWRQSW